MLIGCGSGFFESENPRFFVALGESVPVIPILPNNPAEYSVMTLKFENLKRRILPGMSFIVSSLFYF